MLKLCITGDTVVGKTCLIHNYMYNIFYDDVLEPFVLDVYRGKKKVGSKMIDVEIHDCGGDDHFGINRRVQYADADVFMICVAANSPQSL